MKYGEKVKYARLYILPKKLGKKKISTYELAEMLGVNPSFISHVENPKPNKPEKKYGRDITLKLADLCGIPLETFERDDLDIMDVQSASPTKELAEQLKNLNVDAVIIKNAIEKTPLTKEEALELIQLISKKV